MTRQRRGRMGEHGGMGSRRGVKPLTQQGDAEQRQEHQGARRGPPGKKHRQQPQEPTQEQPVQPGPRPDTEENEGASSELSGLPTLPPPRQDPSRAGTPGPVRPLLTGRQPRLSQPRRYLPPSACDRIQRDVRGQGAAQAAAIA